MATYRTCVFEVPVQESVVVSEEWTLAGGVTVQNTQSVCCNVYGGLFPAPTVVTECLRPEVHACYEHKEKSSKSF